MEFDEDWIADDLFIFAPSYVLAERAGLTEGKAIGTAKHADLMLVKNLLKGHVDPETHAEATKKGSDVARKKLAEVQERTRRSLIGVIANYRGGKTDESVFRKAATRVMKTGWRDAFLAGIRAAGVPGESVGVGKSVVPSLSPADEAWLRSAMAHEMSFLNGFLDTIIEDDLKMPLIRRTKMYVDALKSFYESARVIGLPANVVLWWVGKNDGATCPGCRYMFEHNPYSKFTLPTTPRAGLTPCLTNCRDRLLVRRVESGEVQAVEEAARFSRAGHIANLRKLKRAGKL
jgi:hypothetical protein